MSDAKCFFCDKQPGKVEVRVLGVPVAVCVGCLGNLGARVASLRDWFSVVTNKEKRERLLERVRTLAGGTAVRPEEIPVEVPEGLIRKKRATASCGRQNKTAHVSSRKPRYHWVGKERVSVEDGSRLLKTDEAAAVLGISVGVVRELVKSGRLSVRATYSICPGARGWLVSANDVAVLQDDPAVKAARERLQRWRSARHAAHQNVPFCDVRPLRVRARLRPDPWQERAVEAAIMGKDVLVVAPTGCGKTWVAEELARRAMANGASLIYASPIKALSNQKYSEFCSKFDPARVGIVTGDVSLNPDAPVAIATTEIVRNWYASCDDGNGAALQGVRWVVVDEFHLLDSDRGLAWEEVVLFAPRSVSLVCLSATVPNWEEVAAWLSEVRGKPVEVIVEERRPVPLSWRWWVKSRAATERIAGREIQRLAERKEEERAARSRSRWGGRRGWQEDWENDWEDDWDGDWDEDEEWEDD